MPTILHICIVTVMLPPHRQILDKFFCERMIAIDDFRLQSSDLVRHQVVFDLVLVEAGIPRNAHDAFFEREMRFGVLAKRRDDFIDGDAVRRHPPETADEREQSLLLEIETPDLCVESICIIH